MMRSESVFNSLMSGSTLSFPPWCPIIKRILWVFDRHTHSTRLFICRGFQVR
jgi:hypothetical protein